MKLFQAIIILTPTIVISDAKKSNLRRRLENTITFDNPTHHEKLVDYCLTFDSGCGKPAADAYCGEKGYGKATDYPKKRSYHKETLSMVQHSTCSPAHNVCDAFDYITCRVRKQTYYDPMEHDKALDCCYEIDSGCGLPAADAFCEDMGYAWASDFAEVQMVDEETMTIGDHAVCDPEWHYCSTFSYITCIDV